MSDYLNRVAKYVLTRALLGALRALVEQIEALTVQITEQLHLHADAHVFASLPRAGTVRAARLLAEFGDARGRFPTRKRWPPWPDRTLDTAVRPRACGRVPLGGRPPAAGRLDGVGR